MRVAAYTGVGRSHDHVGRCNGRSLDQGSMKCHCRPLAAVPAVPGPVCRIRAGGSDTRPTAGTNVGNPTARKVPRGRETGGARTLVAAGREDRARSLPAAVCVHSCTAIAYAWGPEADGA